MRVHLSGNEPCSQALDLLDCTHDNCTKPKYAFLCLIQQSISIQQFIKDIFVCQ